MLVENFKDVDGLYVVGGAVRDYLMGKKDITDIDLAVKGDSAPFARRVASLISGSFVDVGGDFNVSRVAKDGRIIFDISGFNESIEEDLARRDFTVNALAIPLSDWKKNRRVVGNEDDINKRILRPVSDTIFQDDGVRLLRAFRLMNQCLLYLSNELKIMIDRDKDCLLKSSQERIQKEFLHLLSFRDTYLNLMDLDKYGLLTLIFPELEKCKGLEQPQDWHYCDVFTHSIITVRFVDSLIFESRIF